MHVHVHVQYVNVYMYMYMQAIQLLFLGRSEYSLKCKNGYLNYC